MWAERFDKPNHENDRNNKRREERRKDKSEFDSDLGGPIQLVEQTTEILR